MHLSGKIIGQAAVYIIICVFVFFVLRSKKKKVTEPEPKKESLPSGLGDYIEDRWDSTLYSSLQNEKIKIRTVKVFGKTEDKDKLIFASSLAFNFNADDKKAFSLIAPQIIEVGVINSHELLIVKSPAAHFFEFNDAILKHLFIYLNRKYDWMNKKITVTSRIRVQEEFGLKTQYLLNLQLSIKTSHHRQLGVLLGNIPEINNTRQIISIMVEDGVYSFNLETDEPYAADVWKKILPKIKEVCTSYFTGGVEFIESN